MRGGTKKKNPSIVEIFLLISQEKIHKKQCKGLKNAFFGCYTSKNKYPPLAVVKNEY